MGAAKITAIILDDSHAEADLMFIVRQALEKAGCNVDSVDVEGFAADSILFRIADSGAEEYVLAIPSRTNTVEWTEDIDKAKVCHGPSSLHQCQRAVFQRLGRFLAVKNI